MTDQNSSLRLDRNSELDDDPLAELARIISGETAPKKASLTAEIKKPSLVVDEWADAFDEAVAPSAPNQVSQVHETEGFDIESELLRELGEAPKAASIAEPQAEPISEPLNSMDNSMEMDFEQAFADELSFDEPAEEISAVQTVESLHQQPVPELEPIAELSIEEQLMAELELDDAIYPATEPVKEVRFDESSSAAHEQVEIDDFFDENFEEMLAEDAVPANAQAESENLSGHLDDSTMKLDIGNSENQVASEPELTRSNAPDLDMDFGAAFDDELEQMAKAEPELNSNTDLDFDPISFEAPAFAEVSPQESRAAVSAPEPAIEEFDSAFQSEMKQTDYRAQYQANYQSAPEANPNTASFDNFDANVNLGSYDQGGSYDPGSLDAGNLDALSADSAGFVAPPSGRGFKMAIGALCAALVVGLGVVGWSSWSNGGLTTGEPLLIKAEAEPVKVKPENPGGKEIANQDNQVYSKVDGSGVTDTKQEELITARQEPVAVDLKADTRLSPDAVAEGNQPKLGLSPKRVKTLTVKPDGTIIAASDEPDLRSNVLADAQSSIDTTTSAFAKVAAEDVTPKAEEAAASIDGAQSTGELAIPEQSPRSEPIAVKADTAPAPKPAAKPTVKAAKPAAEPAAVAEPAAETEAPTQIASLDNAAAAPKVTSSEWKIQVSSQRSQDAAQASYNNITKKFSSVLRGKTANIEKADVAGQGTFYRVKVLASSKDEAVTVCSRLKNAGGSCFVTR